ncbi:unnamed protein product [Spirodela intermedia]|uniref:CASP-like protein n=1 Tax=Spirodela intermedia TaxID=51605 RepID=A0A7I8I9Z5_SPIIN|nr:unnamed protein product [Spirodela intermedia]CAA6654223.1 unnamed protein product [Spirodela intermedia]
MAGMCNSGGRSLCGEQPASALSTHPSNPLCKESPAKYVNFILRLLALVSSLTATILMSVARSTHSKFTVKPDGDNDFEYFIIVHIVVAIHSAGSLVLWAFDKCETKKLVLGIALLDVAVMGLLFSANGTAIPIGGALRMGSGEHYDQECKVSCRFCGLVAAAAATSMLTAPRARIVDETINYIEELEGTIREMEAAKKAKKKARMSGGGSSVAVMVSGKMAFFGVTSTWRPGLAAQILQVFDRHNAEVLAATATCGGGAPPKGGA